MTVNIYPYSGHDYTVAKSPQAEIDRYFASYLDHVDQGLIGLVAAHMRSAGWTVEPPEVEK